MRISDWSSDVCSSDLETSQMFGELIGLWAADLWNRSGRPKAALVELGPGRGTLMADARRAAGRVPGMADLPVHLIETSPALRAEQRQRIPIGRASCRERVCQYV